MDLHAHQSPLQLVGLFGRSACRGAVAKALMSMQVGECCKHCTPRRWVSRQPVLGGCAADYMAAALLHTRMAFAADESQTGTSAAGAFEILNWRVPAAHASSPHWWACWLPVGDQQTNQQGHKHALLEPCPGGDPLQRLYWPQLVLLGTLLLLVPPLLVGGAQQMGQQVAAANGLQAA